MVEIFTKQVALMQADESVAQHAQKRSDEIAEVDKDKNGPNGLFKGLFPEPRGRIVVDDEDMVMRCPQCQHEHIGGDVCENCGAEIDEGYDFSDMDDEHLRDLGDLGDLEDIEVDLDEEDEVDAEFEQMHGHHRFGRLGHPLLDMGAHVGARHPHLVHHHIHHHHHPGFASPSGSSNSEDEDDSNSESEDEGSLQDFVVQDEEPIIGQRLGNNPAPRQPITISDDESDEGGAISNRRPRRRGNRSPVPTIDLSESDYNSTPEPSNNGANGRNGNPRQSRSPSALTVTDSDIENSTNASEAGDGSQADLLRHAGWSPLDPGNDSDVEEHIPLQQDRYNFAMMRNDYDDSDNSDTNTETATENGPMDEEEEQSRNSLSETPTPSEQDRMNAFFRGHPYEHVGEDTDDDSEQGFSVMDHDGDTDMSASPRAERESRSVSANPYYNQGINFDNPSRDASESNDDFGDHTPLAGRSLNNGRSAQIPYNRMEFENLGVINDIQQAEEESSDSSIRPLPRRQPRPRRAQPNIQVQQYNPRISGLFAEHQETMNRGTQDNPISFDDWEEGHVEAASRFRRMTAYRNMPARWVDPLRSSRSPSSTRVISSSSRNSRLPRQYQRRT